MKLLSDFPLLVSNLLFVTDKISKQFFCNVVIGNWNTQLSKVILPPNSLFLYFLKRNISIESLSVFLNTEFTVIVNRNSDRLSENLFSVNLTKFLNIRVLQSFFHSHSLFGVKFKTFSQEVQSNIVLVFEVIFK